MVSARVVGYSSSTERNLRDCAPRRDVLASLHARPLDHRHRAGWWGLDAVQLGSWVVTWSVWRMRCWMNAASRPRGLQRRLREAAHQQTHRRGPCGVRRRDERLIGDDGAHAASRARLQLCVAVGVVRRSRSGGRLIGWWLAWRVDKAIAERQRVGELCPGRSAARRGARGGRAGWRLWRLAASGLAPQRDQSWATPTAHLEKSPSFPRKPNHTIAECRSVQVVAQ
jgi:hypothetical protein